LMERALKDTDGNRTLGTKNRDEPADLLSQAVSLSFGRNLTMFLAELLQRIIHVMDVGAGSRVIRAIIIGLLVSALALW